MKSKSSILFKVLLNRYHPGVGEGFLKCMSEEESKEIFEQSVISADALPILDLANEQIRNTHYSWLVPVIQQIPKALQPLAISSLPAPQSTRISKILNIPIGKVELSDNMKSFFLHVLYKWWKPSLVLPFQYLPHSPLLVLAEKNKDELVKLIDFLALYDLTETLRHIVNKKTLKTIYQALDPRKQQFLKICLHQKEKIASPKLELEKWDGDPQKLERLLHRRGLFRLGKALSGQHPDLLWHLTHKLDIGRGTILSKYFSQKAVPGITSALVQQVIFVINFLKKKSAT